MRPCAWLSRRWPRPDARTRRWCASRSASCPATAGRHGRAAARSRVPRPGVGGGGRRRAPGRHLRRARHRARRRSRAAHHRAGREPRRVDRRLAGQGADRPVGGSDLPPPPARRMSSGRPADVRRRDLPRRVALSGNGPLGRTARRARRVPSARPRRRARQLPADHLCRSGQHVPREGDVVPGGREHRLLRVGQLRQRRIRGRPPRSCVPMGRCSAGSRTARTACSSPTSTCRWPPASSPRAAGPRPSAREERQPHPWGRGLAPAAGGRRRDGHGRRNPTADACLPSKRHDAGNAARHDHPAAVDGRLAGRTRRRLAGPRRAIARRDLAGVRRRSASGFPRDRSHARRAEGQPRRAGARRRPSADAQQRALEPSRAARRADRRHRPRSAVAGGRADDRQRPHARGHRAQPP